MTKAKKILFVSSEILPFMPQTDMSYVGRHLPQAVQESGGEIRSFMPKYGCINERRNQLHEVIRLSGMNIIIKDIDRPLIIKVASISAARMQVYFIDNEDYFQRKAVYRDGDETFFADNDERGIFFARGVLETVKKLRWKPTIVHCHGWLSHLLPLYLKKAYRNDPLFTHAKVVLSLYNDLTTETFNENMRSKVLTGGMKTKDVEFLAEPGAVMRFAGARVIEQTTREKLPPDFGSSESQLAHGQVDMVVDRRQLKDTLVRCLGFLSDSGSDGHAGR